MKNLKEINRYITSLAYFNNQKNSYGFDYYNGYYFLTNDEMGSDCTEDYLNDCVGVCYYVLLLMQNAYHKIKDKHTKEQFKKNIKKAYADFELAKKTETDYKNGNVVSIQGKEVIKR